MVRVKRKLISWAGVSILQPFYERIVFILLRIMNYGAANHPKDSGEFDLLKRLNRYYFLNKPVTLLDVGSNVGQFAAGAAYLLQQATIHCFEPSSPTYIKLQKINSDHIFVNKAGLGAVKGSLLLYDGQNKSVKASLIQHSNSQHRELVEIWTLDDYCQDNRIDFIHLLKIDVEGFEIEVLKGASRMISQNRIQFIQFEFGGINHVKQKTYLLDFFEILKNYTFYRVLQKGLAKLSYKPFYEMHLTTNYLAAINSVNQQYLK